MAVLGLRFRAKASSSCGKRGPLFIAVRGPLTIAASPVAEHRLQTRRLSNCGSRAQPPRGTRDPPRPGPKPASPAPAGRLPTTAPPGKPCHFIFNKFFPKYLKCVCLVGSIQLALVFLIQSDNLWLLTGMFSVFTYKVKFESNILLFVPPALCSLFFFLVIFGLSIFLDFVYCH